MNGDIISHWPFLPFVHTSHHYHRSDDFDGILGSAPARTVLGSWQCTEKMSKLDCLEEVVVITRFPLVNLRKDRYPDMHVDMYMRMNWWAPWSGVSLSQSWMSLRLDDSKIRVERDNIRKGILWKCLSWIVKCCRTLLKNFGDCK